MHDSATQIVTVDKNSSECKTLQGAVNLIARVIPLIFEEKDFLMRAMWHE